MHAAARKSSRIGRIAAARVCAAAVRLCVAGLRISCQSACVLLLGAEPNEHRAAECSRASDGLLRPRAPGDHCALLLQLRAGAGVSGSTHWEHRGEADSSNRTVGERVLGRGQASWAKRELMIAADRAPLRAATQVRGRDKGTQRFQTGV